MPTLLQINVTANWGSTGKIAEAIGSLAIARGWESYIAYGRGKPQSASQLLRIGDDIDLYAHAIESRLLDNHGLASRRATRRLLKRVAEIKPDIIHLHNIHGYYVNYPMLFDFIKEWGGPVVWTLHDCWTFTGHCSHFTFPGCQRWVDGCHDCPQTSQYPSSLWRDRSCKNYRDKKSAFTGCRDLTFVPVSDWLAGELSRSFLGGYPSVTIHNGIDLDRFRPLDLPAENADRRLLLGVASVWTDRKGLDAFVKMRQLLPREEYDITLVGLSPKQIASLPEGITGITRTESVDELVELYNRAFLYVNPTLEDTFPTTNLEALACGTPVITYRTGGSPEAIDQHTGVVVDYADVTSMAEAIVDVSRRNPFRAQTCRQRAETLYDRDTAFNQYLNLYEQLLDESRRDKAISQYDSRS